MEHGYFTKILALCAFLMPMSVLMKKFFMKTIFKELPGGGEHFHGHHHHSVTLQHPNNQPDIVKKIRLLVAMRFIDSH